MRSIYRYRHRIRLLAAAALFLFGSTLEASEDPYLVTYSHQMEEPGNLEIGLNEVAGAPKGGNSFLSSLLELEYGATAWWTAEFYAEGQSTAGQSAIFTGYRIENRVRPLMREHWINPVLYFEFETTNAADKALKEIVGHDTYADQLVPNAVARREQDREAELKLILSTNAKGWNFSENFIAEKNLAGDPWEFGYAFGMNRPLALAARPAPCSFCRENFRAGFEMFGGVGTLREFGLHDTSHYIAPCLQWQVPGGPTFVVSPAFGLNRNSYGALMRFTVSYEFSQFGRRAQRLASAGPGESR
ncbi:MAG: hypothetical protein ABSG25_00435 [Bryobacteraceae bacterium]